ncbi:hypothetical protein BHR43_01840 [Aeromonas salmonicida subsp. salmonicida]|uniref:hypothetical protein n=1 Tax=Aeromonas salmonicida TaxID=645 RepID=UPI00044DDBB5|nr:hypothetical protein [Aeromonas salmonicida]ATD38774.1 hypothetical protein BHG40_13170 [Aeromonas salmonicida subsp. masoucida]KHE99361.1 hypothetical protein NV17_05130 [Aeromonas salmonicida subsp. salmonicida]GAJ49550.1 hypothetical protein ASA01S_053_00110 [Aeromonas salmonicida subsp. masoucida NBRC 13784]ASI23673.1 hypothetical protein CE456_14500 [Aeromonas salmonicida]ASI27992.1 hypothetical protein CE463_14525 [Aeromonas salmonicida]
MLSNKKYKLGCYRLHGLCIQEINGDDDIRKLQRVHQKCEQHHLVQDMDGWMMALLHLDSHTQQQEEEYTDKEETKKARRLDGLA